MPHGGTTKNESIPPSKGVQGDVLWRAWRWKPERTPSYTPFDGGIFRGVFHAAYAAPRSMKKLVPSTGGVQGWVVAKRGPTPKADASAPPERGFSRERLMPPCGTTKDENAHSPPLEGPAYTGFEQFRALARLQEPNE